MLLWTTTHFGCCCEVSSLRVLRMKVVARRARIGSGLAYVRAKRLALRRHVS
jgi:hypothetical protein